MTRLVMNISLDQIEWMRLKLDISGIEALRLLQLYGYLEYITDGGNAVGFKQSVYAKKFGLHRDVVRKDLIRLAQNNWAEVHTSSSSTQVEVLPIPFAAHPVVMPTGQAAGAHPMGSEVPTGQATLKKAVKNSSYEEKKDAPSTLKKELILKWNEWKPKSWTSLKGISPSRDASIRALGGYRAVIDLIPAFMAGAKANKFWVSKDISFENVIGTGKTPKGHFHELAERGANANTNTTPGTLSQPTEHPDFFPPTDPWSDLRPKHHHFTDDADRDRREAEAREFYNQQEAA